MANYVKSYQIKDNLVWTWPGHKSNLLEASHAQRKRNGETSLTTKVYTVDIPRATTPVKYTQWGEVYYSASDSDSEDEPAAAATRTAHRNHPAERIGMDDYGDSEGYSSGEDVYDGHDIGSDDEDENDFPEEGGSDGNEGEGSDIDAGEIAPTIGLPAVAETPAVSDDFHFCRALY